MPQKQKKTGQPATALLPPTDCPLPMALYMQLVTPSVVQMALTTDRTSWRINFQVSFFDWLLILLSPFFFAARELCSRARSIPNPP